MQVPRNLKEKVLKGSIVLTVRQIIGSILSLVSVLVVARTLGPEQYGIATTAIGIFYFFKWSARVGLDTYLVRYPGDLQDKPEQVLSFYNTVGVVFCALLYLAAPASGLWTGEPEVTQVFRWLVPMIWLDAVGGVANALLQRELRFDVVGLIDVVSQIAGSALTIVIVLIHRNYWGLVWGTVLQFLIVAVMSHYYHRINWRWTWRWKALKPALAYGITFFCSNWIFSFKSLTVPLFVTRFAGIEAAGVANIAIRFIQQLSLARVVIRSMSISVMAKLIGDPALTRKTVSRGMAYQALLMGGICAVFSSCSFWLVPKLFGEEWLLSAKIFPLVALAAVIGSVFDLHAAALNALGRNMPVIQLNFAYVSLLWLGSWLLIPPFQVWGYGFAELVAIVSHILIHAAFTKVFGILNYRSAFWLILACIPALFGGIWLPPALVFMLLLASYGCLFMWNGQIRSIPQEIWVAVRSRS